MDVLTHQISNQIIDDFLKNGSNYLFETDAGYVALLADQEVRPFSMFKPFYVRPEEMKDCWMVKDVFRKWAGHYRVLAIVPLERVNLFTQQMHRLTRGTPFPRSRVA